MDLHCGPKGEQQDERMIAAYISLVVNAFLTGLVGWLLKKVTTTFDEQTNKIAEEKQHQEEERRIMQGVLLAIMKDSLYERCFRALSAGKITLKEKENIDSLHEQYNILGGNHNGDKLYERVERLKIIPDD